MLSTNNTFLTFLELANHYPSPHNGQPIQVRPVDESRFHLYFEKRRGLQAAEVSFMFSYVAMGVFVHHLELCAQALGHTIAYELDLPPVAMLRGEGFARFASCSITFNTTNPDAKMLQALLFRQTSRKKYTDGINEALASRTIETAAAAGMQLLKMDRAATHEAIWLNQRAVFDDMFDDDVRHELNHWLRYSKKEKELARDGLAYDCMEMSGGLMKFFVDHYKLLRAPIIGGLIKKYYLRTMKDKSDVFYLLAPFSTEKESFDVGVAAMRIWIQISAEGGYLHPFGTIMSNEAAHRDFLKLAGIEHEDRTKNFLIFIYRAGISEKPHSSLRLPIDQHLLGEQDV